MDNDYTVGSVHMETLVGIITNVFSSFLYDGIAVWKDKKAIQAFKDDLIQWATEFEKTHDGTIVTQGIFYSYIVNHCVILNVFEYVVSIHNKNQSEAVYLSTQKQQLYKALEVETYKISVLDKRIINEFFQSILNKCKVFIQSGIQPHDRAILYVLMQQNFEIHAISKMMQSNAETDIILQSELLKIKDELLSIHRLIHQQKKLKISDEWFINQNREQIKNLGNRYMPELNVPLEISKVFDGIAINEDFLNRFKSISDNLLVKLRALRIQEVSSDIDCISLLINDFLSNKPRHLEIDQLLQLLNIILESLSKELSKMYALLDSADRETKNQNIQHSIYLIQDSYGLLEEYISYLDSAEIKAVNKPYILIDGKGGIGKSHLLADAIQSRTANNNKSLLFLGQHFSGHKHPLQEMLDLLSIDCDMDCFLEHLNSMAEKESSRIIIFIDALNEGNGKVIWRNHLSGIVEKLKRFSWVGLVMTIRSEYTASLFSDNSNSMEELVQLTHVGFSTVEYKAIKKYFDFYKVVYSSVPFANHEFSNPLFLRLFCEGQRDRTVNINQLQISEVYNSYITTVNRRVAAACGYNQRYDVVRKVIDEMVRFKFKNNLGNNYIPQDRTLEMILEIQSKYQCKTDLLEQLLAEGVLTQNIRFDNSEYLYVTYEKLEDYLFAEMLVPEMQDLGIEAFRIANESLIWSKDILECLAIVLAQKTEYEIFDIFEKSNGNTRYAFIESLKWRTSQTITQNSLEYINQNILQKGHSLIHFFATLILLSTKEEFRLNADKTVEYMLRFPMPDRDAYFIPIFDEIFDIEGSSINKLIDWALTPNEANVSKETIRLAAQMLCMFLISSNRHLRDKSTKALVSLLKGHIEVLIQLIERFSTVDDPYVAERLYAVAFGCVVSETNENRMKDLAGFVYENIFQQEIVYPNILLRDYAKSIIDFVQYRLLEFNFDLSKIQPPYNTTFPDVPTDEYIKKLEYDYKSEGFKDYFWSQNAILSSMQIEYSRDGSPGGYGDFGRYVFQRYFRNWKELNSNDLKNIAIKKIFDMGYDVEKHGRYDRKCGSGRFGTKHERIGKKYQWIALYELAAQVSDKYLMQVHCDDHGTTDNDFCAGSFEPNIRNIDPTISLLPIVQDTTHKKPIHERLYTLPAKDHCEWLENFDDLPSIKRILYLHHAEKVFVLLNGWYTWSEEKALGDKQYQKPLKDMWIQVNSYIIKKNQKEKIIQVLSQKDFMGRWLSEPHEDYTLYNKEYYWSAGYRFFQNPYYCGEEWVPIDQYGEYDELGKVLLPAFKYLTERQGDLFGGDNNYSWYKPSGELFNGLQMRYGKEDSVLYDGVGNIVCFDSRELLKEDIGLFINEVAFFKYLDDNDYTILWTLLSEKRVIVDEHRSKQRFSMPHVSGLFHLNEHGEFVGKIAQFND